MHTDPEVLALIALGERDAASPEQLDHIEHCEACSEQLSEMADLARIGRASSEQAVLETPSPQVWDRIRSELRLGQDQSSIVPAPGESAGRSRNRRQALALALAAVLALIVGVGGTLAWQQLRSPSDTVVASTALTALPDWTGATGEAMLEEDASGGKVLVVTIDTPRPVVGLRQVWLIDKNVKQMVPIGQLTSSVQRFPLDAGIDVGRFPVVDVSVEAIGGNPAHSGDSIVRGTLPT